MDRSAHDARGPAAAEVVEAVRDVADLADRLRSNLAQVLRGKPEAVRLAVTARLAGGHLLIEDVPGVGKTLLAKALSLEGAAASSASPGSLVMPRFTARRMKRTRAGCRSGPTSVPEPETLPPA